MATSSKTSSKKKPNQNYSTNLAKGGSVTVKNGVKTYSDKKLNVTGNNGISISGKSYSVSNGGSGYGSSSTKSSGDIINEGYSKALADKSNTITSANIKTGPGIKLPTPEYGKDMTSLTNGINTSLAGANGGTYDPTKGFVSDTNTTPAPPADPFTSLFQELTNANTQAYVDKPSNENLTRQMQKELRPKENLVNSLQNQITQITTTRDANQLKLEGQGRGITDTIIGGQQAKIGREAAIQALPIQAQLAAAQGDLDSARSYLGQLYTAKAQDAQNEYNYKTALNASVYSFLNTKEQRIVDDKNKELDRQFATSQQNLAYQRQLGLQALEFGQQGLISGISSVDPSSPTFEKDMAAYTAQLRKPVAASAPHVQNIKRADGTEVSMMWNPSTGQYEEVSLGGGSTGAGGQSLENLNAKYTELLTDIGDAKKLADSGAVGAGSIERKVKGAFTGNADFNQVENIADTIKANLLTLNTDPAIKKFFGPQMSNRDTELMTGAASTLNPQKQTPEQFKRDLEDSAAVIARAREAVRQGLGQQPQSFQVNPNMLPTSVSDRLREPNILIAPDGLQIVITD